MAFRELTLPSGAILKVAPAPFADSKALYQAVLEEAKGVEFSQSLAVEGALKDLFLAGFSSKRIEACLWVCFSKCVYSSAKGDLKIDKDTFEPIEAREDYTTVCMEVAEENIRPFMKSLYAVYLRTLATIDAAQASRPKTTPS